MKMRLRLVMNPLITFTKKSPDDVDIDAEIQKARDSMKNKKLKKQEDELAKQLKT